MAQAAWPVQPFATVGEVLREAAAQLEAAGVETARLDAELLLAQALGVSRSAVLARLREPLEAGAAARFTPLLARRRRREPLAYVVGGREFWSLWIAVDRRVMAPRPETELVVELGLACIRGLRQPRVLDVGAGSGCIAIAIACERPDAAVTGIDCSFGALEVARANARACGVAERVQWQQADLREIGFAERFDLVVANLPYVATPEIDRLEPEVRVWEPRLALDGGPDGLQLVRAALERAPLWVRPGGWLVVEIGADQGEGARQVAVQRGWAGVRVERDWAGLPRVIVARWPGH